MFSEIWCKKLQYNMAKLHAQHILTKVSTCNNRLNNIDVLFRQSQHFSLRNIMVFVKYLKNQKWLVAGDTTAAKLASPINAWLRLSDEFTPLIVWLLAFPYWPIKMNRLEHFFHTITPDSMSIEAITNRLVPSGTRTALKNPPLHTYMGPTMVSHCV